MPLPACHCAAMMLRGVVGSDVCLLEPYEAGWAREAVAFVCVHEGWRDAFELKVTLECSPDGLRWAAVQEMKTIQQPGVYRAVVTGFGNWLRASLSAAAPACVDFYWVLK